MNYRSLIVCITALALCQNITASPARGGAGAGPVLRTPPRAAAAAAAPGTLSVSRVHRTPVTPGGRRHLINRVTKAPRTNRVIISDDIVAALNVAVAQVATVDGRLHHNGVLLSEQRVAHNYPYNLRSRIQKHRDPTHIDGDVNAFGGNTASLVSRQKNEFKHVVPLQTIINIIQMGHTFGFHNGDKLFLEIIIEASLLSEDPVIAKWLTGVNEIHLTFGYPKDSDEDTDPFLLFHAMGDRKDNRKPELKPIQGVEAYIDDTVFPDGRQVLRFRMPAIV